MPIIVRCWLVIQMQGVYAVDPATGKSERLKRESADQTIASAKRGGAHFLPEISRG